LRVAGSSQWRTERRITGRRFRMRAVISADDLKNAPAKTRGRRGIISVGVDRFSSSPFASAPGSLLRRRARLLVAVTAADIGVFYAHRAASTRAGTRVPLPRALVCSLPRNVIGRRTRSRGVDETTAGGLTGGSTVGSAGVPLRRVIRLRRAIGWSRTIAWRRRAILRVRPRHPGGRSSRSL
jgi:hypothetical protein